jgi:TonB family protein
MKRLLFIFFYFAIAQSTHAQTDVHALASALQHDLQGNVLLLRGFPVQSDLKFDSHLNPERTFRSGSWTEAASRVDMVEVKGKDIVMTGQRAAFIRDGETNVLVKTLVPEDNRFEESRKIKITLKGPFRDTPDAFLENVKQHIFVMDFNELKTIAPPWWQPYLRGEVPANARRAGIPPSGRPFGHLANGDPIYQVGKNAAEQVSISAPKVTKSPDPEYTELARIARFQGVTVLSVVVLPTGDTGEVKIVRPLGMGLDDRAVATVQTWKFNPAMKDGTPVPVQISVEVSFNLY